MVGQSGPALGTPAGWVHLRGIIRRTHPPAQLVAAPAASLVQLRSADHHAFPPAFLAVGPIRGIAAHHADRERLRDVLGDREQLRHGLERFTGVVLVEAGDDDALPPSREPLAHLDQVRPEELSLVDADHLCFVRVAEHILRGRDGSRRDSQLAVGDDLIVGVSDVDRRLEDLDLLAGDERSAQAANQLFSLAAVHAPDDDFDPTGAGKRRGGLSHGRGTLSSAPLCVNERQASGGAPALTSL